MFYYLISKSSYLKESNDKYIHVLIYGTISYIILHALLNSRTNKFKHLENYFWSIFSIDCISIYSELKNDSSLNSGVAINTRQKNAIKKKDNKIDISENANKLNLKQDLTKLTKKLSNLNQNITKTQEAKVNNLNNKNNNLIKNNINNIDTETNFTPINTNTEIKAANEADTMDLSNLSNLSLNINDKTQNQMLPDQHNNLNNNLDNSVNKVNNINNLNHNPSISKNDYDIDINKDIKNINNMIESSNKTKNIISLDTSDEDEDEDETDLGSDIDINQFENSL